MKLILNDISKTYKSGNVKALCHIQAELEPGVYALLGPNGAGKSTLMNIMTDNIKADSGEVRLDGENILQMGAKYRSILGYMPQQQEIYDDFTAQRFLWYMSALKGLGKKEAAVKIEELLELVGLKKDRYKKLGTFSGGMKQRILLAQALLNDPKILILDEPTAGLDPKERIKIRNFISQISKDKLILFSTHVVSDIEYIAKEIIVLKEGHILCKDTSINLLKSIEGKVYEIILPDEEIEEFQKKYRVSQIASSTKGIVVRFLSEEWPENMEVSAVSPNLEDFYLYHFCFENEL